MPGCTCPLLQEQWEQLQQAVGCLSCLEVMSLDFAFFSHPPGGEPPRLCLTALSALTNLSIAVKHHPQGGLRGGSWACRSHGPHMCSQQP